MPLPFLKFSVPTYCLKDKFEDVSQGIDSLYNPGPSNIFTFVAASMSYTQNLPTSFNGYPINLLMFRMFFLSSKSAYSAHSMNLNSCIFPV